jgi:diacylglycerol kinase family enzyme
VRLDCRLFGEVARRHAPALDRTLPPLSNAANHSKLWLSIACCFAASGGRRGRRAATRGIGSVAVTSLVVNQGIKRLVRRPRPSLRDVPVVRRVPVSPFTTSFPSGHAASAAAFAAGVAAELAPAGAPLTVLAAAVASSRTYVGVHYPLDVVVGACVGASIARLTCRVWPTLPGYADAVPPSEDLRQLAPVTEGEGVGLVVNSRSGSALAADSGEELRSRLPRAHIVGLGAGAQLPRALEQLASTCEIIGICGGDGSAAAAAEVALDRSRPMLLIPGGTLNHLARDLRVNTADDVAAALASGEAVGVDVGDIDGRLFLNSAGLGAYPDMLDARRRFEHRLGRWAGQLAALILTLLRAEPLELTVGDRRRSVWMGFVGNCRHEPAGLGPSWRPRLDDGCFDVRLLLAESRYSRQRLMCAIVTGRLASSRDYVQFQARELRIESNRPHLRLACDGECFDGHGDFGIEKRPNRVAVYALHQPAHARKRDARRGPRPAERWGTAAQLVEGRHRPPSGASG